MIGSELLDDPRADPVAVGKELHDIARLNALFGGTRAVVAALDTVFRAARDAGCEMRDARWTLLDIGTGLGDIPRAAVAAARRHGVELTPMGMDRVTRHDAVLSLRRGYTRGELNAMLEEAGAPVVATYRPGFRIVAAWEPRPARDVHAHR